jgi:hypothetical protein
MGEWLTTTAVDDWIDPKSYGRQKWQKVIRHPMYLAISQESIYPK